MKKIIPTTSWRAFVTRPVTLLERYLRFQGYHKAGLKQALAISKNGMSQVYINKNDWDASVTKAVKILRSKKIAQQISNFKHEFLDFERLIGKLKKYQISTDLTKKVFRIL